MKRTELNNYEVAQVKSSSTVISLAIAHAVFLEAYQLLVVASRDCLLTHQQSQICKHFEGFSLQMFKMYK